MDRKTMNRQRLSVWALAGATLALAALALPAQPPKTNAPAARQTDSAAALQGAQREIYKTIGDVRLPIYIFTPADLKPSERRPAMVFFFGGGWTGGTPAQFALQCRYLASRGMVAMTADYRVFGRHGTPVVKCVEDARSAIRWVRANAARLGVDPKRIAAGGGSAGGHLAACTALLPDLDAPGEDTSVSCAPNALVLFNPALALSPTNLPDAVAPGRLERLRERFGAEPERLSPLHHVRPGAPPTLILHGKADAVVPYRSVEQFAEAMKKAGNRCELIGYEGRGHGFFNHRRGNPADFIATTGQMDRFLASLGWLEGPPDVEAFLNRTRM
jgi:acetyl esterase/lipase